MLIEEFNIDNFFEYFLFNIWLDDVMLFGFKNFVEDFCCLIIDVVVLVVRVCDRFVEKEIVGYFNGYLEKVVSILIMIKVCLLYYFFEDFVNVFFVLIKVSEIVNGEGGDEDDWCVIYLDYGCLIGLILVMFVDEVKMLVVVLVFE